jgi:dCTP deaminase
MPDSFSTSLFRTPAMSIKSDKWIRRMAQEHGMIEPFVERQMRGSDDSV